MKPIVNHQIADHLSRILEYFWKNCKETFSTLLETRQNKFKSVKIKMVIILIEQTQNSVNI